MNELKSRLMSHKKRMTTCIMSILIAIAVITLARYETVYTQTELDFHFSRAMLAITLLIFLCKKVSIFNKESAIVSGCIFIAAIFFIYPIREATTIAEAYFNFCITQWLVLLIFVDMIKNRNFVPVSGINKKPFLLYCTMTAFVLYNRMGRKEMLVLAFPLLLFFTIRFTKEEWEDFLRAFFVGWLLGFYYIIVKSLEYNPPSLNDRWFGLFPTLATFGFFIGCSFVVSISGFYLFKCSGRKRYFFYFINCLWLLSIVFFLALAGTRTTLLGAVGVFIIGCICSPRKVSKKTRNVLLSIGIVILFMLFLVGGTLSQASDQTLREWMTLIESKWGNNMITYTVLHILSAFMSIQANPNPYFSGIWAMLDVFAAQRLTVAKFFWEATSFSPNGITGVYIGEWFPGHAHNTYLQMLYQFGIPTGVLVISFFVYGLIDRVRCYKQTMAKHNLLPIFWMAMMLTTWLTETVIICSAMTVMGIMLLYPYLVNIDEYEGITEWNRARNLLKKIKVKHIALGAVCLAILIGLALYARYGHSQDEYVGSKYYPDCHYYDMDGIMYEGNATWFMTDYIECAEYSEIEFELAFYTTRELVVPSLVFFDENYNYLYGVGNENQYEAQGVWTGKSTVDRNAKYVKALYNVSYDFVPKVKLIQ